MELIGKQTRTINIIIHCIFILFSLACIVPLVAIISISFSTENDIVMHGYELFPRNFTLTAYEFVFANPKQIVQAYIVSISVTVVGTILSLLTTSLLSYTLSRPDFRYRNKIMFFVYFTMLFNGGLVPWYILVTKHLHLKDNFLVLVLPYLVLPWFVFLLRTYFQKIPFELVESAKIDGSSELRTFFQIIVPLSKPALATVGLFIVLRFWNDWWLSLLFINNQKLVPLQLMLKRMLDSVEELNRNLENMPGGITAITLPSESTRMAMCLLAAGPVLFIFPFFQKYFVKGLTVGAVKG